MTDTRCSGISKADINLFLFKKRLTGCTVCGRFRSNCDDDVQKLSCQRVTPTESFGSAPVDVLMIVCQNCGAIQFHDRAVIAQWLECQRKVKA